MGEQEQLPLDHHYLRCVEQHDISGEDKFRLVICMTTRMSLFLVQSRRISFDTSFKRVHGWQEFEVEGWDNTHKRCKYSLFNEMYSDTMSAVVLARAFTTSQSAEAHLILFRRIFDIAQQDIGVPVQFFHIHGVGIESVVADGHRGQALGEFFLPHYLCTQDLMLHRTRQVLRRTLQGQLVALYI